MNETSLTGFDWGTVVQVRRSVFKQIRQQKKWRAEQNLQASFLSYPLDGEALESGDTQNTLSPRFKMNVNAQELLDQLLASGKQLAAKGKELVDEGADYASNYIEIPEAGPERDELMAKVGAGVAATGLLALLIGTEKGRKTLSPVIKVGSLAAMGALGYKAYQNWQKNNAGSDLEFDMSSFENKVEGEAAEKRSIAILRAMVGASKSDGEIDAEEHAAISGQIKAAGIESEAAGVLLEEMGKPSDATRVADLSDSPAMSVELYLASLLVTGQKNEAEKTYLSALASALKLEPELVEEIHREAALVS